MNFACFDGPGRFWGFKRVSWSFYPVERDYFRLHPLIKHFTSRPLDIAMKYFPFYFYLVCFFSSFCGNFFHFCSCCLFCRSSSNKRIFFIPSHPRKLSRPPRYTPFSSSKDLSFSLFSWFFMFFFFFGSGFYFIFIAAFVISYFMIHLTAKTETTKHKKLSLLKLRVRIVSVFSVNREKEKGSRVLNIFLRLTLWLYRVNLLSRICVSWLIMQNFTLLSLIDVLCAV